jgi:serine/threonine-protein kinase
LTPGTRIGPYEITAQIGAGGMGEVYRATDLNLGRDVAIKVLPDAFAQDAERLVRFEREAKTLASLNHPSIAIIHGLERADGVRALVMELVEGQTLADRIAQGPIPVDEALPIARQIAEALEAAHEQAIIHRDLKPANIKLRPDGTVKVLDFGLAKAMEPTGAMSLSHSLSPTITTPAMTQMGMILGTAAYMSPEQAKGRPADKRSDIWAFGCVLYEMLTGTRPFKPSSAAPPEDAAGDVAETLAAVLRGDPNWTALPRDTPSSLVALVKQCLQKDRRQRVGDIAAALFALREPFSTPAAAAVPARARTSAVVSAALTAGLAVLLTSTAWWTFRAPPPPAIVERLSIVIPDDQRLAATVNRVLAISRDGGLVAFAANQKLYVRRISAFETTEVSIAGATVGFSYAYPAFSPDGRSMLFIPPLIAP